MGTLGTGSRNLSPSTGGAKAVLRVGMVREEVAPSRCRGPGILLPENVWDFICKILQCCAFLTGNGPFRSPVYHPLLGDPDKFTQCRKFQLHPYKNEGVDRERDWASDRHTTDHATCNICGMTEQNVSWSMYSSVAFLCVLKHFNNGSAMPMRPGSFSTMGTAFPRVHPRNDPCSDFGVSVPQLLDRGRSLRRCSHGRRSLGPTRSITEGQGKKVTDKKTTTACSEKKGSALVMTDATDGSTSKDSAQTNGLDLWICRGVAAYVIRWHNRIIYDTHYTTDVIQTFLNIGRLRSKVRRGFNTRCSVTVMSCARIVRHFDLLWVFLSAQNTTTLRKRRSGKHGRGAKGWKLPEWKAWEETATSMESQAQ